MLLVTGRPIGLYSWGVTDDMRKNLGMLVLAIPVALAGLALGQVMEAGVFVVLFAGFLAVISIVKIGAELMRPRGPQNVETDAPQPR